MMEMYPAWYKEGMTEMYAAFYKGEKFLFNQIVRIWDKSPYSHMEILFKKPDGEFNAYSSSFSDGGVRVKPISLDPDKWDIIRIDGIFDSGTVLDYFLNRLYVTKYDLLGTFGFVIGPFQSKSKLFCSEACMESLGFDEAWRYSPGTAFQTLLRILSLKGEVLKEIKDFGYCYQLKGSISNA